MKGSATPRLNCMSIDVVVEANSLIFPNNKNFYSEQFFIFYYFSLLKTFNGILISLQKKIFNIDESSTGNWMTVAIEEIFPVNEKSLNVPETSDSRACFALQTCQKEICGVPLECSNDYVLFDAARTKKI